MQRRSNEEFSLLVCNKRCMMLCLAFSALAATAEVESSVKPTEPRCEYMADPIGIDVSQPRLSWKLVASDQKARNLSQSAYRVIVASTRDRLAAGDPDLWDTGKVSSADSTAIEYRGKALPSGATCW